MRIRKNRKLSSFMPAELIQAYDCQLNQSPWDVISFFEETETDKSSFHHFERENNSTKDGSLDNFIGGIIGSDTSFIKRAEKAVIDVDDICLKNGDNSMNNQFGLKEGEKIMRCSKNDGEGWLCPNESKQGYSLCEHHLNLQQSDNVTPTASDLVCKNCEKTETTTSTRRDRPQRLKKGSTSTNNSHEFYYYSGFGPFWGKKRSKIEDIEGNNGKVSFTQIDKEKVICIDENEKNNDINKGEDEIEDIDNEHNFKKRKNPVKARSLQSIT